VADSGGRDFFISYTGADRAWAEWIAVQLEAAGHTTMLQAWDFRPGSDFVEQMHRAIEQTERTIAVLSQRYLASVFAAAEWHAIFAKDPTGQAGLLVPVRIEDCEPPGLLRTRVYIDLVAADEEEARRRLLAGVDRSGARPTSAPFPGAPRGGMRFPGQGPAVSNLPARNRNFSGRYELLEQLHASLQAESAAAVVPTGTVHGLGGVGKTELALEFAHRYQADYDIVWWITAEQPTTITADLAALAEELGIERLADQAEMVRLLFRELRGRDRWLLVYDNAEQPRQLEGLLPPGGGGHVLVTSRYGAWGKLGSALRLDVVARSEAVAFLSRRTGATDQAMLDALADELGDLPLALEEAAAYLEETGVGLGEYLQLVRERARELFGLDQPPADQQGDQRRVATVWSLSLDRVHQEAPAAEALLNLCAFLAPDIPRGLPREQPQLLPEELAQAVSDALVYNRLLAVLGRYSLATVSPTSLGVHRLVQAVIQARLGQKGERHWTEATAGLLRASFPDDAWEVATWATCERLLPHVLAVAGHAERLATAGEQAGWLLDRASSYLRGRGLYRQARPVAERALALTEDNQMLAVVGRYSLATVTPTTIGAHRLVQAVIQARLGQAGERRWAEVAIRLLRNSFPKNSWEVATWPRCERLLPQVLAATRQSERLRVAGEQAGWLLERSSIYLRLRGQYGQARPLAKRALAITEAALGPAHPQVGARCSELGQVLLSLEDLPGAKAQCQRAVAIGEAALGPNHPELAVWRGNLGSVLWRIGDLEGAKAQHEQALTIEEIAFAHNRQQIAIRHNNLGLVFKGLGDLPRARAHYEQAVAIGEAALGPNHPSLAVWHHNLGRLLGDLGDLAGAKAELARAIAISEATLGSNHPDVAAERSGLGSVLWALGDLEGAREQLERAVAIGNVTLGPNHPVIANRRGNLALVLKALGDLEGAREELERALEISEAALGPDHPTVSAIRSDLGSVLQTLHEASQ
jgi:tetratricopeptide (TPR) repeat protein